MIRGLTCLASALALVGCTSTATIRVAQVNTKPPINLPNVKPLDLSHVTWIVVNESTAADALKKIKDSGQDAVIIGLSPKDYKLLIGNQAELLRYIRQQRSVIIAYKNYAK